MSPAPAALVATCGHWFGPAPVRVTPLPGAGLSGSLVYAVDRAGAAFILKSFPPTATRQKAEWVHALMRHVRAADVEAVPGVARGAGGATVHEDGSGTLWEMVERMPGAAVREPSPRQVEAAGATLARVHLAAASLPEAPPQAGPSPGVERRIAQAREIMLRPWAIRDPAATAPDIVVRLHRAASLFDAAGNTRSLARMASATPQPLMLQAVLRDVWSDHVLFVGEQVTGIIDWHAAGIDTPATDIARLLSTWGSWDSCGSGPGAAAMTTAFLHAYERVRPLSAAERDVIPFLQAGGVVCALDNWFRWTIDDGRAFADMPRVLERIDGLLAALPDALARLADEGGGGRLNVD